MTDENKAQIQADKIKARRQAEQARASHHAARDRLDAFAETIRATLPDFVETFVAEPGAAAARATGLFVEISLRTALQHPAAPASDDDDPLWSDLFGIVQRDVKLPPSMRLLLRPDETVPGNRGRWYFQIECERPDTFTGEMGTGRGGKAYLSPHMAEGELVQVAFGLVKGYVEHEAREAFLWRGRRVFGPHIATEALWEVAECTEFRSPR